MLVSLNGSTGARLINFSFFSPFDLSPIVITFEEIPFFLFPE